MALSAGYFFIRLSGLSQRQLCGDGHESLYLGVESLYAFEHGPGQFDR
jgi:hypothetical protein